MRTWIQSAFFVFIYFDGLFGRFLGGARLSRVTGYVCVPGYQCSACDWVSVGCPIGMLQYVMSRLRFFPFYAAGVLASVGLLVGAMPCGWVCPVGFAQDIVWRLRQKLFKRFRHVPDGLRSLKIAVLVVFVLALPAFLGGSRPWAENPYCDYLCPIGAATVAVPAAARHGLDAVNPDPWTWIRYGVLGVLVLLLLFVKRPVCTLFCPILAVLGRFNRVSLYRMRVDRDACVECDRCRTVCPMDLRIFEDPDSPECVRCLRCRDVCPRACVTFGRTARRRSPEPAR